MPARRIYKAQLARSLSVTLPENLWPQITEAAKSEGISRSAFIAQAVAAKMGKELEYNPAANSAAILR